MERGVAREVGVGSRQCGPRACWLLAMQHHSGVFASETSHCIYFDGRGCNRHHNGGRQLELACRERHTLRGTRLGLSHVSIQQAHDGAVLRGEDLDGWDCFRWTGVH